jgi:hypothetical protein
VGGGDERLVFILSDKTMPSMVHCQTGKGCPEIIRVDNGAISGLIKVFLGCYCTSGLNIPPVSVAVCGSASRVPDVGVSVYSKDFVAASRKCLGKF